MRTFKEKVKICSNLYETYIDTENELYDLTIELLYEFCKENGDKTDKGYIADITDREEPILVDNDECTFAIKKIIGIDKNNVDFVYCLVRKDNDIEWEKERTAGWTWLEIRELVEILKKLK